MSLPSRLVLILALSMGFNIANAESESHCTKGEIIYFSCTIKDSSKVVSLCGGRLKNSSGDDNENMWLQYRFGALNSRELEFPKRTKGSISKFRGEYHYGQSVAGHNVVFQNGNVEYSIGKSFSALTGIGFEGVTVSRRGKKIVSLPCASSPVVAADFNNLVEQLDSAL